MELIEFLPCIHGAGRIGQKLAVTHGACPLGRFLQSTHGGADGAEQSPP
jgi:hypothetical protein